MSVFLQNLTNFATIVNMSVIYGGKRSGNERLSRSGNDGAAIFLILFMLQYRHEGKCKTLYRGYTMKVLRRHSITFFMRQTLLFAVVCMLAAGSRSSAEGSSGERLGAGVAEILDEETEISDLKDAASEASEKDGETDVLMAEALQTGAVGEAVIPDRIPGGEKDGEEAADADYDLVMANVSNTLNVRQEPDEEAKKVGYLYADCGGTVLERKNGWTKLKSGDLTGWAKDEFLLFGQKALEEARKVGRTVATVTGDTLRIRKEPAADAAVYDLAARGEIFRVVDAGELEFSDGIRLNADWAAVDYEGRTGYVSADYITVEFELDEGETLEEIAAREAAQKEAQAQTLLQTQEKNSEKAGRTGGRNIENTGVVPAGTSDAVLLAALIQCEAGSEIYEGQLAVGAVVINRMKSGSYPNSVSGVIYASGQFGPAGTGKVARLIQSGNIKASCLQAANEALAGATNVGTATHFRRAGSREGIVIGNHVFW